jgi:hypothetical protein
MGVSLKYKFSNDIGDNLPGSIFQKEWLFKKGIFGNLRIFGSEEFPLTFRHKIKDCSQVD